MLDGSTVMPVGTASVTTVAYAVETFGPVPFATVTWNGIGVPGGTMSAPLWVFVIDRAGSTTVAVALASITALLPVQFSTARLTSAVGTDDVLPGVSITTAE